MASSYININSGSGPGGAAFQNAACAGVHNGKLRVCAEPDALRASRNDTRNALKRVELQAAILQGSVMSQVAHGPVGSGQNQFSEKQIAAPGVLLLFRTPTKSRNPKS